MAAQEINATPAQPSPAVPNELTAEQLRWRCPADTFQFATTAELEDLRTPPGQTRAMDALRLGASIASPNHHIYAMGEPGTGKHILLRQTLEQEGAAKPRPADWCYVNRFDDSRRPRALRLDAGRAAVLRADMHALMEELKAALPAAFHSDTYRNRRQEIDREFETQAEQGFTQLKDEAERHQMGIVATPTGLAIAPVRDGRALDEDDFQRLPAEQRADVEREIPKLTERLRAHFERLPELQRERRLKIRELDRNVINLAIRGVIATPDVYVRTDPVLLSELLQNLLANAIRYTDSGRVELRCRPHTADLVLIEVEDTGIGIPPSLKERIFDDFFQVAPCDHTHRGGAGLGLGIVRRLSRALSLPVRVDSTVGAGTRFTVEVPAGEQIAAIPVGQSVSSATTHSRGERILLVEDDRGMRDALKIYLELDEYEVRTAASMGELDQLLDTLESPLRS